MATENLQYISDDNGTTVTVIVPIALWHDLESERETTYLLKRKTMKNRLLAAHERQSGMSLDVVCEKLGI